MAEYGKLYKKLWNNEKFISLHDSTKLLFNYLVSNQHCNLLGLYVLHVGYIMGDLHWSENKVKSNLAILNSCAFVEYDKKSSLMFVPSWFEHNSLTSELQTKKALAELSEIPKNSVFLHKLADSCKKHDNEFTKMVLTEIEKWFGRKPENGSNSVSVAETVTESETVTIPFEKIITHLNHLSGKNFDHTKEHSRKWIKARWQEKYTLENFYYVNQIKAEEWLGTEREQYLRPKTLYSPEHFETYLNQRKIPRQYSEKINKALVAAAEYLKDGGFELEKPRQAQIDRITT